MHNSFNEDKIYGNVKNIFDCNRCAICDAGDGSRMRCPCGHTACDECVSVAEECLICLTPPKTSTPYKPVCDGVLTKRVQNATTLLKSCPITLNTDVLMKQRISEQLKVEKEVFPDCIQAPVKYCNKRKSLNTSGENKSRRLSPLPGEQISFNDMKMEKSSNFINAWFNKHEKTMSRKPLGDVNVNQQMKNNSKQSINGTQVKNYGIKENTSNKSKAKRKRSHKKSPQHIIKTQSCLNKYLKSAYEFESTKIIGKYPLQSHNEKMNVHNNDESGIVMDDGPIIIDDSQNQIVDKDKEAWLAVHEAIVKSDSSENINSTNRLETTLQQTNVINDQKNHINVPFYKKSYMLETCQLCSSDYNKNEKTNKNAALFKDNVSISIESNSFITTIQVCNTEQSNKKFNKSVLVQTDMCLIDEGYHSVNNNSTLIKGNKLKTNVETKQFSSFLGNSNMDNEFSQNIFTDEVKITDKCHKENLNIALEKNGKVACDSYESVKKTECVVDESDSDLESSGGVQFEVSAEIHRSCDLLDYGVLTEVLNQQEHSSRQRRTARGYTPTSTDSSEKENFNPNRAKRTKFGKKEKK